MSTIYRERTLDQISEADVDKTLRVAGWVENIRDHGGVSFIDLRDMYGVLQVVMRDTTLLDGITKEDCVTIEGLIEHRDEDSDRNDRAGSTSGGDPWQGLQTAAV